MGRGGNVFYFSRPHTLLSYTYPLPYSYSMGDEKSNLIPVPDGFGYPRGGQIFIIKKKYFFVLDAMLQCIILQRDDED